MLNVAHVLPGPGERDADVFPLRERLQFRDKFGLALLELRARGGAFRALAKGPWALFIAISAHWQSNAEAWPSQSTLARFTGWSSRCVRDQTDALERGGFIRLRRERRPDGSERLSYAPGLVTVAELAAFLERFPRGRAKPLLREPEQTAGPPSLLPTDPPEAASGTPPEESSAELSDLNWIEPSSCETTAPAITIEEEKPIEIAEEDRAVARAALAQRMRRKHPARAAPRWFDAGELAMVAACSSAIEGDREAKLRAHREALDGAYLVSRDGPPTARFIWGKLEHFLDHVERGRKRACADMRAARLRDTVAETSATPAALRVERPAVSPAQMRTDIERIFGPVGRRDPSPVTMSRVNLSYEDWRATHRALRAPEIP